MRGDVAGRIGPLLLELAAGVRAATAGPAAAGGADAAQVRRDLGAELYRLAGQLPADLRAAILAALALHPATREMATYDKRRAWVAAQVIDRVPRTAERRIDQATDLLAQEVAAALAQRRGGAADGADDGWYIEHCGTVFLLDGEAPEALERRRIVATRDGLTRIATSIDVPRDAGQQRLAVDPRVLSGGELIRAEDLTK